MQETRLPVQVPPPDTAGPVRLILASIWGLVTIGLLVVAGWMLYDILDVYGNLEGEPWEFVAMMMGGAAVSATAGVALWKPKIPARLLAATFLTVALIGAITFGALVLLV